jgi:hypothetical protein
MWEVLLVDELLASQEGMCSMESVAWTIKYDTKIAEFRTPTPQDVWKKGSTILKVPRFAIVLQ